MKYLFLIIPAVMCYAFLHEWRYQDNKNKALSVFVCAVIIAVTYYLQK